MHSRFDTEARIAVAQATDIARELGHSQVGPDHLLLGLLANMRGTAYAALADHGLRLDAARDLVAAQHTEPPTDDRSDAVDDEPADEARRLDEDREALRAVGIDLDRVTEAVRENLGADLTEGWGGRTERRARGRSREDRRASRRDERRESRRGGSDERRGHHHGRGRRGPRSERSDDLRFSSGLRDLLREVRRATLRDRREREPGERNSAGPTGQRLALALLASGDPVVQALLATATDLDGLRARLEAAVAPTPAA